MSVIQLRTFPGLWVGRRQVLEATAAELLDGETAFQCGACDTVIRTESQVADFREVVVKCACGEFNQL